MSEETAIQAFNTDNAAQVLRDKVRNAFVEFIPADEWEQMIKNEAHRFFTEKQDTDRYGNKSVPRPSDFSVLAKEVLAEMMKEDKEFRDTVREALSKEVRAQLDARLPDLVRSMANEFINKGFSNVVDQLAYSVANRLPSV